MQYLNDGDVCLVGITKHHPSEVATCLLQGFSAVFQLGSARIQALIGFINSS